MLEEIGYDYKVTKVDLGKDEQFKPEFIKLSPFGKIPVIIDHENNKSLFESGAILMYLGDKSGKLYNEKDRLVINQWLMAQMGTVGPMIGQHHQFHHYNPGKSEFGEERYFKISFLTKLTFTWIVVMELMMLTNHGSHCSHLSHQPLINNQSIFFIIKFSTFIT